MSKKSRRKRERYKYVWFSDEPWMCYPRKERRQIEWLYMHKKFDVCLDLIEKVHRQTFGQTCDGSIMADIDAIYNSDKLMKIRKRRLQERGF